MLVTIEPVKSQQKREEKLVQCRRCQKYGHSKNYCYYPQRCVRCGQAHLTAKCTNQERHRQHVSLENHINLSRLQAKARFIFNQAKRKS